MAEKRPLVIGSDGLIRQLNAGETLPGGAALRLYTVRTRTTINVNLATALENGDSQGGVTLATGDLILVYNQTTQTENGLYVVKASGTPDRAGGAATGDVLLGALVVVTEGTYAGRVYLCTGTAPATVGTSNIIFADAAGVDVAFKSLPSIFAAPNYFAGLFVLANGSVAAFGLKLFTPAGLTADRTLTIDPGDADRTLTIGGNTTLNGGTHSGTNTGDEAAASDTVAGKIELAVQSEMETATDVVRAVVPGRQQYHPSAAKAWVVFTISGTTLTMQSGYNVSSVTRNAVGDYTVNFTTAFSNVNYSFVACCSANTGLSEYCNLHILNGTTPAVGSIRFQAVGIGTQAALDIQRGSIAFFGDQ